MKRIRLKENGILRGSMDTETGYSRALEHHQKFDGSGYPSMKGGLIPNITSQFITIADVFDTMRSRRFYQNGVSPGEN